MDFMMYANYWGMLSSQFSIVLSPIPLNIGPIGRLQLVSVLMSQMSMGEKLQHSLKLPSMFVLCINELSYWILCSVLAAWTEVWRLFSCCLAHPVACDDSLAEQDNLLMNKIPDIWDNRGFLILSQSHGVPSIMIHFKEFFVFFISSDPFEDFKIISLPENCFWKPGKHFNFVVFSLLSDVKSDNPMESSPDLDGGGGTTLKFCDLTETTGMLRLLQILILMPYQCFIHFGKGNQG